MKFKYDEDGPEYTEQVEAKVPKEVKDFVFSNAAKMTVEEMICDCYKHGVNADKEVIGLAMYLYSIYL